MKNQEIKLLKETIETKGLTDLELVTRFYEFLINEMGLSKKKAFSIVYHLQEHLPVLNEHIEQCSVCGTLYHTWYAGRHSELTGKYYCSEDCEPAGLWDKEQRREKRISKKLSKQQTIKAMNNGNNLNDKLILDACCGSRMFWFDKENPIVLFGDIRKESHELCDGRTLVIDPDVQMDFREMPFEDNRFRMVVFDPPHIDNLGESSFMAKKYGVLSYHWRDDIRVGFDECMRVLMPYGVLILKWNEARVKLNDLLSILPIQPLFGHTSGKHGKTIWLAFMKFPIQ